jgi:hypothetical protein
LRMKKIAKNLPWILFTLIVLSSCATFKVRIDSTREWIEGKPFPVRVTFTKMDNVTNIVLNYSFNGKGGKAVTMNQAGNTFTYTIPGEEVVQGALRYNVSCSYKGKLKSQDSGSIAILSFKEAKEKYTKELHSRVSFSPPAEVPINRDRPLSVTVKSPKPSTTVTFYHKTPEQAAFRETALMNSNGTFTAVVGMSELQAGYDTYYFKVTEENADVGKLETYVGDRDGANPFRYYILSLAELKEIIIGELRNSVSHNVPQSVYVTRDLKVSLSVAYGSNTFIREFTKNTISVDFFYKNPTSDFKHGMMSGVGGQFTYTIPSTDLKSGYNSYYFKVTDNIEDIGAVAIKYPSSGDLFNFKILTIEEIRKLKTQSLRQRTSHTPVKEVDGVSDLNLKLKVENAGAYTTAILFFKKPTDSKYKSINMTNEGNVFEGAISINDQQNGFTQYYFSVTETDDDVGTVSALVPENGQNSPIKYTVSDKNTVKAGLESDLRARIFHTPVTSAADGKDLTLSIEVKNMKPGALVYFYHRKPGESSYRQTKLTGNGPQYVMVVPKQDVHAGYSQYFFEVKEPHKYFGFIEATIPTSTAPFEFKITKLKDAVVNGIDFTPLPDAEYRDPVEAKIKLNNNPEGTRVFIRYRLADDTLDYLSAEMKKNQTEYSAVLSPAILQEGKRIDYYFFISADQDEFTYPDERIIPLFFKIKKQIVENRGNETVFGTTGRAESNMLEGRIFQFETGTKELPQNMHKDYKSLLILYTKKIDIPPRNFTEGFPGLTSVFEWFGIQYRGSITVKKSGLYTFRLLSDDGSKLYIDSNIVIENDGIHSPKSKTGEIYLSPGTYPIRVDYFQGPKMQIALQLFVAPPGEGERLFDLKDFE